MRSMLSKDNLIALYVYVAESSFALGAVIVLFVALGAMATRPERRRWRRWYLLYAVFFVAVVVFMCAYVPIAFGCVSLITSSRKMISLNNEETDKTYYSRQQRRQMALTELKRLKKDSKRYAKRLRMWRECKRSIRLRYGWIASCLCEPWLLQLVLCVHWCLTWWVSLALGINVTKYLGEECLHFLMQQCYANHSSRYKVKITEIHRCVPRKRKRAKTIDEEREYQRWQWRLLLDPVFKKAAERNVRRRRARNRNLNVCLRMHLYRTVSNINTPFSVLPADHLSTIGNVEPIIPNMLEIPLHSINGHFSRLVEVSPLQRIRSEITAEAKEMEERTKAEKKDRAEEKHLVANIQLCQTGR